MLDRLHSRCDHPDTPEAERLVLLALILIIERINTMPTQADLDNATDALLTAFNAGIDAVETTIAAEVAKIQAIIASANIPQSSVDKITAATAAITAALAKAQTDIAAEA